MKHIKNFFCGLLIGFANTIPGVSGGTMAVILNIYDKILYAVSLKNLKKNLPFLLALVVGAAAGVFICAEIIMRVMKSHEMILNFCFIGLILGSIPAIYRRANDGEGKARNRNLALFFLAFVAMILFSFWGMFSGDPSSTNRTLSEFGGVSVSLYIWLFVCVFVSTLAMILPGISGSLLMLILGVYTLVLEAINEMLDLITGTFKGGFGAIFDSAVILVIPIGLGVILGLFLGIKLMKIALRFHPQALYFIILGLVVGSVFAVITQTDFSQFAVLFDAVMSVAGLIVFTLIAFFLGSRKAS